LSLERIILFIFLLGTLFWGLINSAGFISIYFIEDIQNAFEVNLFPENLANFLGSYVYMKILFAWLPFAFVFLFYIFRKRN
tara:strand:+ start:253 stop:495 length:243 start_codon:yes stop_codon:yes gene_type:complete